MLEPLSDDAQNWIEEHIPRDAQYFGNSVAIEHRYVIDVIDGNTLTDTQFKETTMFNFDWADFRPRLKPRNRRTR